MPYLLLCAFVANAASFVLPISNPANLRDLRRRRHAAFVALDGDIRVARRSVAIASTFALLYWTQRREIGFGNRIRESRATTHCHTAPGWPASAFAPPRSCLLAASALRPRPWPADISSRASSTALVLLINREGPGHILKGVSMGVLPLVRRPVHCRRGIERHRAYTNAGTATLRKRRGGAVAEPLPPPGSWWHSSQTWSTTAGRPAIAGSAVQAAHVPDVRSRGGSDRRRSRTEPVRHRIASHDLAADRPFGGRPLHIGAWQFLKIGAVC